MTDANKNKRLGLIAGGIVLFLIILVSLTEFKQVNSGTTAILLQFGQVQERKVDEGLQIAFGLGYEFVTFVTRTKKLELMGERDGPDNTDIINSSQVTILTDKNLPVPLDVSILYRLNPEAAKKMYRTYGRDITYDNKLIVPSASSTIRGVIGKVDIYELNTKRETFEKGILHNMNEELNKYGVTVEAVRIKKIHLPEQITQAVLNKERAKEEAEQKKYEIERAQSEAAIEVAKQQGISDANEILNKSISDKLLKFKEIEIQLKLLEKWDGKLPTQTTIVGGKASVPLNMLLKP